MKVKIGPYISLKINIISCKNIKLARFTAVV